MVDEAGTGAWFAELAWLPDSAGAATRRVLIETDGERITAVTPGVAPPAHARHLPGLVLPAFGNAHSHAFQRALRGRAEAGPGTFWTWRDRMYELAAGLDPDSYRALARATYAEMALAGVTTVGEFHYVHHRPDGRPYPDPNTMQSALADAAAEAGVRLTLLDTCYLRGGFDRPVEGVQRRFSDGGAGAWARRAAERPRWPHVRPGAAIHSVRAVDAEAMTVVRDWAVERGAPLHIHVSEQPAENAACLTATGRTPTALLADRGVLGPDTTVVHASHIPQEDVATLGAAGARVCLCPTTERSLGDGVGPAPALRDAGCPLSLGSDSHAAIDLLGEARAVELEQRVRTGTRGHHPPAELLTAATRGSAAALGWDAGEIARGHLCDLVAVDLDSPRLAGFRTEEAAAFAVFAATAADVTHVVRSGQPIVADGEHLLVGDVAGALRRAIAAVAP